MQRHTDFIIYFRILPQIVILLKYLVSITTKWLPRATEFVCRNIATILQRRYSLLQYEASIATKLVFIVTKLSYGNMCGLLPQPENLW